MLSLFIEAYLQEIGSSEDEEIRNKNMTSILLSLFGWELRNTNELICKECNRVIGLWNYHDDVNRDLCEVELLMESDVVC